MKNHFLCILLLICFGAPFYGTYYSIIYQKIKVKKEIQEQLSECSEKRDLVHLKFSRKEINSKLGWEHDDEFEYNGKMYDVVKSEIIGDSAHFWCLMDTKETKLNQILHKLIAGHYHDNPVNKEKNKLLDNFSKALFFSDLLFYRHYLNPSELFISEHPVIYISNNIIPLTPPPELD